MEKPTALRRERVARRPHHDWRPMVAPSRGAAGVTLVVGSVLLAMFLLWRRVAGELDAPLAGLPLLAVAVAVLLVSACGNWLSAPRQLHFGRFIVAATGIATLFAVTLPGTALWAACLAWSMVIAYDALLLREAWDANTPQPSSGQYSWRLWVNRQTRIDSPHPSGAATEDKPLTESLAVAERTVAGGVDRVEKLVDERLHRQISRGRDEQGRDFLSGWVRLDFQAGQRSEVAHVEFCPPFASLPKAKAWCEEDASVQVKIAQCLHHGMVLEVRLGHRPTEEESRTIAFQAAGEA